MLMQYLQIFINAFYIKTNKELNVNTANLVSLLLVKCHFYQQHENDKRNKFTFLMKEYTESFSRALHVSL